MIYKFKISFKTENEKEDIYREIEIADYDSLEDLHNAIVEAFGLSGEEMACFYLSDKFGNQGQEYNMVDEESEFFMESTYISDVVGKKEKYLIYVYDLINMYCFWVELKKITQEDENQSYPNVTKIHGMLPAFMIEEENKENEIESEFNDFEFDQREFDQQYGFGTSYGTDEQYGYNSEDFDGMHIEGGEDEDFYDDNYGYDDEY